MNQQQSHSEANENSWRFANIRALEMFQIGTRWFSFTGVVGLPGKFAQILPNNV
jgi:hypothetical protein